MKGSEALSGEGIQNAVLIAGPTASGKSALALDIAERENGVIVNADSMQVYSVLKVLTARPGDAELARAPHLLYGHVDPGATYSTGVWLRDVEQLIAEEKLAGRRPIFVGGTGLYFRALLEGLSAMPDIPDHIRAKWRARLDAEGAAGLHRVLQADDPVTAKTLKPGDGQRIVRALEVLEASGRSIRDWQSETSRPLIDQATARLIVLDPPRPVIRERIARRFEKMVEAGAVGEVQALLGLGLDPAMPAMKAIGVPEIAMAIGGEIPLQEAVERATIATRQYAKRQATWFRHQLGTEWERRETTF